MMKRSIAILLLLWGAGQVAAQPSEAGRAAKAWHAAHEREILTEFSTLLAIPNIARVEADMRRNAGAIAAMYA